ncbi:rootletin isoform X1 [Halyomorpha halys]|uniref:rootletin isoform X1 n=2 Tax=Halyomorpha halys TaxID=286706 RepID=UPI0006D52114|nr:rootletin isoform X1 [Halyomorpha halys]
MQYAFWYMPQRTRGEGSRSSAGSGMGDDPPPSDYRHSSELKRMLEDEAASCRRRIETYKQAQQHQAALVSKLQAKLLQYKQRCKELEGRMEEVMEPERRAPSGSSALEAAQAQLREIKEERVLDLETTHRLLLEERKKYEKLVQVNTALREQLEDAHETNEALANDLQKLSTDWADMRDEMIIKENEWKEEEQSFNDYYSAEHARLLTLWRDVVNLKRHFTELQSATSRDLIKMKSDLSTASRDILDSASGVYARQAFSSSLEEEHKSSAAGEVSMLKEALALLKAENDATALQLRAKEDKVQMLIKELRAVEERCNRAEIGVGEISKLQTELELLQTALRDIAHAVLQDAETRDSHVHLTPQQPIPPRSPKRGRPPTSAAFVESTISAVQASLHKYQLHIHELQVKLENSREQAVITKRQLEAFEEANKAFEVKIGDLTSDLDRSKSMTHQLTQEKDNLTRSLEAIRTERSILENNKMELNERLEDIGKDLEKTKKLNIKLQKTIDSLEEEKKYLYDEIDRLKQDAELREMNLRTEEEKCSRLKEETLTLREELAKAQLARDLLEQQKNETDSLLMHIDKSRGEVELELEQVLLEKSDMHESLAKAESLASQLEVEKKKLIEEIKRLQDEKAMLQNQVLDQDSDLASMRKEILNGEQTRLDLDSEKVSLQEKCKFLEMEKEKVELELAQVIRERSELSNQLTVAGRKREALAEEVSRIKQRLEQANETNSRINRSLEDLVKDCENKQVILEGNEKEIQRLQEQIASMRADKEALEATLFDTQANLEDVNSHKNQLDKELQELLVQQESLKGEVTRLKTDLENTERKSQEMKASLLQQSGSKEGEYKQTISNLQKKSEETINKLTEEKEQVRVMLEKKLHSTVSSLEAEKDLEIQQLQQRISALQQQIENVVQQHEEVLLRAESEKQQALLLAQQDQQAIAERLEDARREIEIERAAHERNRREAATRCDQDRTTIVSLRESLTSASAKYDLFKTKCEEEKLSLENRIAELVKERDAEVQQCEDLKLQLHFAEDRIDSCQTQLSDTARRLKDVENHRESLIKELTDVKRQLADASFEREKYSSSNKELREHVKRVEGQKREQARSLEEALQKIAGLEEAKRALDMERSRLQAVMRDMDRSLMEAKQESGGLSGELEKARTEIEAKRSEARQLEARIASVMEERDRAQQHQHQLSKQIQELENALENMREEVAKSRSKGDEEDRRWRQREEELLLRLEDSRAGERKLQDTAHNLEVCLADATQQIQELKARLGGSEGRVRALEAQLIQVETSKREVESKLSSVGSTLRRIAGIQMDGSISLPYKLSSPTRRWSPVRGEERGGGDLDPEAVRRGVRALMQGVAQVERERDDLKAALSETKKHLRSQNEELSRNEARLASTMGALRQAQEEKGSLEARLGQKEAALQAQSEASHRASGEIHQVQEKLNILEIALKTANEEKSQCEEKLEKLKQSLFKCDSEKKNLQEELNKTEGRATKLELQRLGMEGDIQRLQIMLQEKESTIQKLQERLEVENSTVAELEERCGSLKATIEQLTISLEKSADIERELQSEIDSLQRSLVEVSASSHANADKLKNLQKAVYNAENEKRITSERLDASQAALSEARRSLQVLKDAHSRLQSELASSEVERSALESQVRLAQWPSEEKEESRRQVAELTMKLETLQDRIRQLEGDKRTLERKLHSSRSKSYERGDKISSREWGEESLLGSAQHLLEQENLELKTKIRRLENELLEKEAELQRLRNLEFERPTKDWSSEADRYKTAKQQAERLLEARESSHRQQVLRLENQIRFLKEQLNEEVKRRQLFVMKTSRAGREVQQLHRVLGSSLRNVSQDPSIDPYLLEKEARRLDASIAPLALPPPQRK